ncbi:UDP-N-acetylglucosamine 2-epimerase (non-hydrolyzing) [Alkalilimnicola ehrlichii]|uniref:UDP-N-acetylglucosamine 2-epimerase (Non-hydrolyzing) n=1 Tax=Alkalilimnicola ehrlichii TaxID=351052 RepID=A0A3E0WI23_9GAMM|nr:UDP-N-acetylglucosamine 2-epimerase (non-hydrolyzing) [Alkalilimnicola ehrlichii]RFA25145.1 UDP-N-acetylglucosamine 2-epimerase (non-hydrolyzing) [Alkalilimnicola ehrlichii]RFA32099.1 UDP-N-acetylglucosamine 2-epimerase (non-hydrolyzing) [Alkalilimnicola ehrlichii]
MKLIHVVGARPNFMKVAPIIEAFDEYDRQPGRCVPVEQLLVHTGQHYDRAMSELFFEELGMPKPDINLNVGSGPHGQQTGRIMEAFEPVLLREQPDLVLVVGDVNSTLACALDAKKLNIPVAHVEAGLRSGDRSMPEEINRLATDAVADLLFTTDAIADACLHREGVDPSRIFRVGNVMIDSLLKHRDKALQRPTLEELGLVHEASRQAYALVTLHRPGNVDDPQVLRGIVEALMEIARDMHVVFPLHPRSRARFAELKVLDALEAAGIRLLEPMGYLDFVNLTANARLVLTDSGGIQEETTILGVPCLTLRPNTERPVTVNQGTNRLIGNDKQAILGAYKDLLEGSESKTGIPSLWDGRSARRIVDALVDWYAGQHTAELKLHAVGR